MGVSSVEWGRAFPVEGGLLKMLLPGHRIFIQGSHGNNWNRPLSPVLDDLKNAKSDFGMVEMMSCEGGCIDGPC